MRVLLAEDNESLARATAAILSHGGFEVTTVYDGQAALETLTGGDFDAAVLDIMMPLLDGLEVLKRVRAEGNPVPVLLLTAKTQVEDKVAGLDDGANDYLTKPFDARELIARVKAIARPRSGAAENVSYRDLQLHPATLEVSSQNGSLRLDPHEFSLLQAFCLSPATEISTSRLNERVWGGQATKGEVELYVNYLNGKLAAMGSDARVKAAGSDTWKLQ